jgi:hypothetical protein
MKDYTKTLVDDQLTFLKHSMKTSLAVVYVIANRCDKGMVCYLAIKDNGHKGSVKI